MPFVQKQNYAPLDKNVNSYIENRGGQIMADEMQIKGSTIRLIKGDITDIEVESFVYYARSDLSLGSGFGNAISVRGGPSIQEELNKLAPIDATKAVMSEAGNMKAKYIIHAVGPKFQEPDIESKLKKTVLSALTIADEKGIKQIAFPAMGAGFYGVPLDVSADVTISAISQYLTNGTNLKDVIICLLDTREYLPFQKRLESSGTGKEPK
jgi:O-acetyl-ADP-ribose deacetylase (regulator of RNase III)